MIIPKKATEKSVTYTKNLLTLYQKGALMDSVMQQFSDWLKGIIKETLNKLLEIERDDGFPELMDVTTTCDFLGIKYDTLLFWYRPLIYFHYMVYTNFCQGNCLKKSTHY